MEIEGVRKYNLKHLSRPIDSDLNLVSLIETRNELYKAKLVGEDNFGIGYGNLSERLMDNQPQFVITGSQTGNKEQLQKNDFSVILSYNFENFYIESYGLLPPSSESLTHAAIYEIFPHINAIIHIHSEEIWNWMLVGDYLKTEPVEYGTQKMVEEVKRIYRNRNIVKGSVFAMSGHTGGIISFGKALDDAKFILHELSAVHLNQK